MFFSINKLLTMEKGGYSIHKIYNFLNVLHSRTLMWLKCVARITIEMCGMKVPFDDVKEDILFKKRATSGD